MPVTIDAHYVRNGLAAIYLLKKSNEAMLVDSGTSLSKPYVLQTLQSQGIEPKDVTAIFVTHVHLDHAGGAGALLQDFPNAMLYLHPRGARHLVDPARLIESAKSVYGESLFTKLYGTIVPAPAARVKTVDDEEKITMGGCPFRILHTPGHARHHYALFDEEESVLYSGDAFGVSYRELDSDKGAFVFPTTTPTQFEPEAMKQSFRRLAALTPQTIAPTHFSTFAFQEAQVEKLCHDVDVFVDLARKHRQEEELAKALMDYLILSAKNHGVTLDDKTLAELFQLDARLNTQGLLVAIQ